MWKVYDRDGQLAITLGWQTDWDKPQDTRMSYVGTARTTDWPELIGKSVKFTGNIGTIYPRLDCRRQVINTNDTANWERVSEARPVKKPRRGKRQGMSYDWEWDSGQWRRVWL